MLTDGQIERYSRQIILPRVGGRGQQTLLAASVAVVGAGSVGCAAALYLAAAGVGRLDIIDDEPVQRSDLASAVLHTAAGVGSNRAESAVAGLDGLNPDCRMTALPLAVTTDVAAELARDHDVVVDAGVADASVAAASSLINAACVARRTPVVWGRANGCVGCATTFAGYREGSPCYECLRNHPPTGFPRPDGPTLGLGLTAGFIGSIQATEAIKILLGIDTTLTGHMLIYDTSQSTVREVAITKDPYCATCRPRLDVLPGKVSR